jgi:sugar lactone lactonase YvrE
MPDLEFTPLPVPASTLGESPFWHPDEEALYWCDIAARAINRFDPASGEHRHWQVPSEPACAAPRPDGGLVVAMRDGIFRLDTRTGERERLVKAPYDQTCCASTTARPIRRAVSGSARSTRSASRTPRCIA